MDQRAKPDAKFDIRLDTGQLAEYAFLDIRGHVLNSISGRTPD